MADMPELVMEKAYRPYFATSEAEPVQYQFRCIPPKPDGPPGPDNWTLTQLGQSAFNLRLKDQLGPTRKESGKDPNVFLAPTVSHLSGVMLRRRDFVRDFRLGPTGPIIYRPEAHVCADGVQLNPGEGFIMSSGGCPVVILTANSGYCGVAHAGLESLIDPFLYLGVPGKSGVKHPYPSIIDAMVADAEATGATRCGMTLRAAYAIPWQAFRYSTADANEELRRKNRLLHDHMHEEGFATAIIKKAEHQYICLDTLIWLQAKQCGIASIDVSRKLPYDGNYAYTRHTNPELAGDKRNLVIVIRPSTR